MAFPSFRLQVYLIDGEGLARWTFRCSPKRMSRTKEPSVRYAIVGLGDITQEAALPAFHHCLHSRMTAFVSSDPEKTRKLGSRYGVSHHYSYEQYGECLNGGDVDAVYIALPNHMHREYVIGAARAGKHILCEKPMGVNAAECREMIEAARRAQVRLMIAYRLHFEEGNLEAVRIVQSGEIGEPRYFSSAFSQQTREGNVRLTHPIEEGGGPVFDLGVYCINAARYIFQDEPIEISAVSANNGEPRFSMTDETTSVTMRFPEERLATFTVSFGAFHVSTYVVAGTKGSLHVEPAYGYTKDIKHQLTVGDQKKERTFPRRDQFGAEIDYFSDCVLNKREPEPDGEEGLIDVTIVEAIYESARDRKPVRVDLPRKARRPNIKQAIYKPPVEHKPEPVHASSPSD